MTRLWRSPCGHYSVEIVQLVYEEMVLLAKTHAPNEVGTALVGTYSDSGYLARVSALAPLSPDSIGGRTTFQRGIEGLRVFFARLFRSSKGQEFYVGEWHSHPGGVPEPSGTDDRNIYAIAQNPREQCPECILVIVSLRETVEFGVFVYSAKQKKIRLEPQSN